MFGILGSQKVGLRNNLRPVLELESGSNDPMAYMLTIILIQALTMSGKLAMSTLVIQLILQFGVGGAMGLLMGNITRYLGGIPPYRQQCRQRRGRQSGHRHDSILIIGSVFFTFAATNALSGNGYLAVYISGIAIGNSVLPNHRGIAKFMDGMTWLAQIVVFLMLGLLVNPHEMMDVAAVSLLIGAFMILVGRPLSVFISLLPLRKITFRSKTFISWVGLRGRCRLYLPLILLWRRLMARRRYSISYFL